jgi:hypothetical protein
MRGGAVGVSEAKQARDARKSGRWFRREGLVGLAVAGLAFGLTASASPAAHQGSAQLRTSLSSGAAKRTYYGGGAIPSPKHEQLVSIVRTSTHRVDFYGGLADNGQPACGVAIAIKSHVAIRADGSFSASGTTDPKGQFQMSGHFTRRDGAVGTAHAKYTTGTTSCATGKIHWRVYAPSLGLGSGALARDAFYGGLTSQTSSRAKVRLPVALKVNQTQTKVSDIILASTDVCKNPSHNRPDAQIFAVDLPIQNGKFHHTGHGSYSLNDSETAYLTWTVHGRFKRHRVVGDSTVTIEVKNNADGTTVDTCGGDTKHWQASRHAP